MEVWILYGDDIESSADLAHEVRRFKAEAEATGITLKVYKPADFDLIVDESTRDSMLILYISLLRFSSDACPLYPTKAAS